MRGIVLRGPMLVLALGIGLHLSIVNPDALGETPTKGTRRRTASAESKDITIRNTTADVVHYTIRPTHSRESAEQRVLAPGSIDRLPGESSLNIEYRVKGALIVSPLDPGRSYSFRHDENGELELFQGSHGRADAPDLAPYITTPMSVVDKMLQLARVDGDDVIYDLGCGDGRIVIQAAKKHGARGVGIDIDPERIEESNANAREEGVEDRVAFRQGDVMKADFSSATVVTLYLIPESNRLLRPVLERQLKPGTYVVSHNYEIPGWESRLVRYVTVRDKGEDHHVYAYLR